MTKRACGACEYYAPESTGDGYGQPLGSCRFGPPVFLIESGGSAWPNVRPTGWCGCYSSAAHLGFSVPNDAGQRSKPLSNSRHETFCQGVASGASLKDAYIAAGYREQKEASKDSAPSRLRKHPAISSRISALMSDSPFNGSSAA